MTIREMLEAHPQSTSGDLDALVRCVEACSDCAAACTSCADADLGERGLPELIRCIRLCLDCADVCDATGRIVTRQTASDVGVVRAAVEACRPEPGSSGSSSGAAWCARRGLRVSLLRVA